MPIIQYLDSTLPGQTKTQLTVILICMNFSSYAYPHPPKFPLLKEWFEPIVFRANQEKLSTPIKKTFTAKPALLDKEKSLKKSTRNLIINLGLLDFTDKNQVKQQKLSHKKTTKKILKKKIKKSLLNYRKLFISSKTYEEKFQHLDFEEWILKKRQAELRSVILYKEGKDLKNRIDRIANKLKLDWEVLYGVDIEDLRSILQDVNVRNIILIAHGNENGILFDYDRNPYPKSIFIGENQTVQSISIFSCYSEKAAKLYKLDSPKIHSIYHQRYLFYLHDNYDILYKKGSIYSNGVGTFIQNIDHQLARLQQPEQVATERTNKLEQNNEAKCTLKISGFHVHSGLFQLLLNRNWIGSLKHDHRANFIGQFDCSFLNKNSDNVLLITHAKPNWPPHASIKDFRIELKNNTNVIDIHDINHFHDQSGRYLKSKILFSADSD